MGLILQSICKTVSDSTEFAKYLHLRQFYNNNIIQFGNTLQIAGSLHNDCHKLEPCK